jgi:hypothetical protein
MRKVGGESSLKVLGHRGYTKGQREFEGDITILTTALKLLV